MNFIISVFFLVVLFRYPKLYYAFINECTENQTFNFISFLFLIIFLAYFIADIYFLYGALLPFLVEFLCPPSSEIENVIKNKSITSDGINHSPLLSTEDNNNI